MASGVTGLHAQNDNGDASWPDTPVVDDAPLPQQRQARPRPATGFQQTSTSSNDQQRPPSPEQAEPVETNSPRPTRNPLAQQSRVEQDGAAQSRRERDAEASLRRPATAESGNRDAETLSPPVPGRREAPATIPRQPAPITLTLAQTLPAPPPDDGLGKLIGQMLIVGFQGSAPDESWPRKVAAQIESGKIGGVLVMNHNMSAPQQLAKLTGAFRHTKAQIAPFIAVDQGGGEAQRLPAEKGFQHYASAAELGMSNDPLNAYNLYQRMAVELAVHGFNVNFGPVVDLQQTGENGAASAKDRRYGSQPKHVAAFAKAFRLAHHGEGLLTVLKHFPGPAEAKPEAEARWDNAALEPYRQLVSGGNADMVMVGHLAHAEFSDEPGLPASLSKKAIQTRLREEIGFKGVIISDDLEAKAVTARFPLEESVVRAIAAGNDLVLIGNQDQPSVDLPERLTAIIKQAVTAGVLTRERLQASYDRIIAAKQSVSKAAREIASAKQTDADEEKPAAP
jgi:beta-N-acetylhexosaminidase